MFEEVRSDQDFDRIRTTYAVQKRDFVFAAMPTRFNDKANPTYGALIQRKNASQGDLDRWVAVIDCRGSKLARRFFTRWHEIAHRLTTHADSLEPVYRSKHDPIERLMDEIAGHIGFYDPLFQPAYDQASRGRSRLALGRSKRSSLMRSLPPVSRRRCSLARRVATPVVYVEAALAHKKEMKRRLQTPSLFGDDPPPGELRAVKVTPNRAAQQERFTIPTNMRVPPSSVIHRLFGADLLTDADGDEDLSQWESQGRPLECRAVVVEAR